MHGEFKVPGGKLVVADFDVVDGRLANVRVSGDFFLEPDDTLRAAIFLSHRLRLGLRLCPALSGFGKRALCFGRQRLLRHFTQVGGLFGFG